MSLVTHRTSEGQSPADRPPLDERDRGVWTGAVYVLFTSLEETLAAAHVAGNFAHALGLPVTIVHVKTVPHRLPLDGPDGVSALESEEFRNRTAHMDVDVQLRTYRCRTERDAIPHAFPAHSLIVVSNPRRWWNSAASRWRRTLEAAGHFVVSVDAASHKEPFHA